MSGIQKDLGPKGLQVIEAAINQNADVPGFIKQYQPAFPVGIVDHVTAIGYMQFPLTARPPFVPYLVLIDRTGTIRAQYNGSDPLLGDEAAMDKNLREEVTKYLSERTKSSRKAGTKRASANK